MKMNKNIGPALWGILVDYAHFIITIIGILLPALVVSWIMGWDIEMSLMAFTIARVISDIDTVRKESQKAVTKVEALKEAIIETYSTTRSTPVGDREFEAIAVQGQVFREKFKKGKSK